MLTSEPTPLPVVIRPQPRANLFPWNHDSPDYNRNLRQPLRCAVLHVSTHVVLAAREPEGSARVSRKARYFVEQGGHLTVIIWPLMTVAMKQTSHSRPLAFDVAAFIWGRSMGRGWL